MEADVAVGGVVDYFTLFTIHNSQDSRKETSYAVCLCQQQRILICHWGASLWLCSIYLQLLQYNVETKELTKSFGYIKGNPDFLCVFVLIFITLCKFYENVH